MTDLSLPLHRRHPRTYRENKFVYPVLSRRSKGISIGLNLNPDKVCNFDCIYCQVDRRSEAETRFVETDRLLAELDAMLDFVISGAIYEDEAFRQVPPEQRRLNDIAFSGDGEPTTFRNFDVIVEQVAQLKRRHGADTTKMVLITNASMFHRPAVKRALEIFDASNGEIWAKLDAGTDDYYQLVERTKIPFRQVLDNISNAAAQRPLVIQSLFMRIHGEPPTEAEIDAYCARLNEIAPAGRPSNTQPPDVAADKSQPDRARQEKNDTGRRIKLVQVYTVARQPAESFVTPLEPEEVDRIAARVRELTSLSTEVYYG